MIFKKQNSNFKVVKLCLSAIEKNYAEYARTVVIKDDKMIVTNGHRLHIADISGLVKRHNGQWWIFQNTKSVIEIYQVDGIDYPDYEAQIPKGKGVEVKKLIQLSRISLWGDTLT